MRVLSVQMPFATGRPETRIEDTGTKLRAALTYGLTTYAHSAYAYSLCRSFDAGVTDQFKASSNGTRGTGDETGVARWK